MDRRNEAYRDQLQVESIEVTVQRGQLRWLGHHAKMGEERLARKLYEAKEDRERKNGKPRIRRKKK